MKRTVMFTQRREQHLKSTSYHATDNNRELHLKHPASSVNMIRQYRQMLNVKRNNPKTFFDKLFSFINK